MLTPMLMEGVTFDLTTAATNYTSVWGNVASLIAGNTVLMIFLFGGLLSMAFRHFKKAKGAVR